MDIKFSLDQGKNTCASANSLTKIRLAFFGVKFYLRYILGQGSDFKSACPKKEIKNILVSTKNEGRYMYMR